MKNITPQRLAKNAAKVLILANWNIVSEMLSQGYNYKNIHQRLAQEYETEMSYHTFCFWMRKFNEQQPVKAVEKNSTVLPAITTGTTPQGKFIRPESVDSKDLF